MKIEIPEKLYRALEAVASELHESVDEFAEFALGSFMEGQISDSFGVLMQDRGEQLAEKVKAALA